MSLPPALLARLANRGLVQKQALPEPAIAQSYISENEEVIAEDYDELDSEERNESEEYQAPSQYDYAADNNKKRTEDNFWIERMKARMGESVSYTGYKGCPNKYNIWHKCTLYCVNRWEDGRPEPKREYMRRYKRLLRKYPLPKGWVEVYDPGCSCYYFCNATDNVVSWLPPTHPKSNVTKPAAIYRRQLEETTGSDEENNEENNDMGDSDEKQYPRELDDSKVSQRCTSPQLPPLSSQEFPSLQETQSSISNVPTVRKQKSRDLDRAILRQRRDRDRDRGNRRRPAPGREDADSVLDPMDPSAYSDTPRGKWSDGLRVRAEDRKKSFSVGEDNGKEHRRSDGATVDSHDDHSTDEEEKERSFR